MSALDLHFISLYRIGGQEWPQLPGLLALNPPRKTARGRDQDRLLVYLTLAGNMMYSTTEYTDLTSQAAQLFYATAGSLTFALKTAVEWLNTTLVERNMKTTGKGQYCVGALMLAALRGDSMYIVQSGPTHAYWLTGGEARHYNDPALAGKGLGLSQTARMYFAQVQLNPGDRMLFCAALPPNWDKALTEERGAASLEATRRRLLAVTDSNISAVLFRTSTGSGAMNILRPAKDLPAEPAQLAESQPAAKPAIQPASPAPAAGGLPAAAAPLNAPVAPPQRETQSSVLSRQFSAPAASQTTPQPAPASDATAVAAHPPTPVPFNRPAPVSMPQNPPASPRSAASRRRAAEKEYSPEPKVLLTPERREKAQKGFQATARFIAKTLQGSRLFGQKIASGFEKALPRLLPGGEDEVPMSLPGSWLGFIAVVIPILVVTVAVMVYNWLGIPSQFETQFLLAQNTANQTLQQQNFIEQRKGWMDTLAYLDTAEQYRVTDDSIALRNQAQSALDILNRTVRVDYKPAFSSALNPALEVTHMAASDTEIYLLDNARGNVIRGVLNGSIYDTDPNFKCEPGNYENVQVGPLVDMLALPRSNSTGATLMGIDANGNVLYCAPGETPWATALQIPDVGLRQITSIAFEANNLYVLDASGRAVWVYFGGPDIEFAGKLPYFFFEEQIPAALDQAIGIVVSVTADTTDLYLLHSDGHLTTCTSYVNPLSSFSCTDQLFIDTRPGYQSGATLADGIFSQIAFTGTPTHLMALLQPHTQSVFRFSARALELQNQVQPLAGKKSSLPPGMPITAMAYSPNEVLFIFVGHQLYFAAIVP